jgi:hypothetical protein
MMEDYAFHARPFDSAMIGRFDVPIPGKHRFLTAFAALALCAHAVRGELSKGHRILI